MFLMTDPVAISLVTALASVAACVMGVINNIITTRSALHIAENRLTLEKLEKNTNSMTTDLVKVTGQSEYAKGILRGKDEKFCENCPLEDHCPLKDGLPCPIIKK